MSSEGPAKEGLAPRLPPIVEASPGSFIFYSPAIPQTVRDAAMSLPTALFDYALPERLIAQTPALRRDQSCLLVVDRHAHRVTHHVFGDLPRFLRGGDLLVRNNASVLPARLLAQRETGGRVECFLLRPAATGASTAGSTDEWWCLLRPARKLPAGATFAREGAFLATVRAREGDGLARVAFSTPGGESIVAVANRLGEVPFAAVEPIPGHSAPSPADLVALVRDQLPKHCVPVDVVVVDELPRTQSLKVSLQDVAALYSRGTGD